MKQPGAIVRTEIKIMPPHHYITPPGMRRELVARQQKAFEKFQESGVTCYGYGPPPETEIAWLKVWAELMDDGMGGRFKPSSTTLSIDVRVAGSEISYTTFPSNTGNPNRRRFVSPLEIIVLPSRNISAPTRPSIQGQ